MPPTRSKPVRDDELAQLRLRLTAERERWDEERDKLLLARDSLIAEREHLTDALKHQEESQAVYQSRFYLAPVPYLALAENGIIHDANRACERLLGKPSARLNGTAFRQYVVPADRKAVTGHLALCKRTSERVVTELRLLREPDPLQVEIVSARGADATLGTVLIATPRQRHASSMDELVEETKTARAEVEARDRFIAMLSHELRTPLTPLLAAASLLDLQAGDNTEIERLSMLIRRNVAAEARMIDDLLDLSRLSHGKLAMQVVPTDVHDAAREALAGHVEVIHGKRQKLIIELGAERHHVSGDALRLRQIFSNLLSNAVKFTPSEGTVSLRSWNQGPLVVVEVADSGIGFSRDASRLFEPFEQSGEGGRAGGLGLGLAICKGLVAAHGGKIHLTSPGPGQGVRVAVELPTVAAPLAVSEPPAATEASEDRTARVLLVEDDPDTVLLLSHALRASGYQVINAASGRAALEVDPREIDVIVSDIGLPDMTGWDMLASLMTKRALPAIALNGYGAEGDMLASRRAGFVAHLTKPIDVRELVATIVRALSNARAGGNGSVDRPRVAKPS